MNSIRPGVLVSLHSKGENQAGRKFDELNGSALKQHQ